MRRLTSQVVALERANDVVDEEAVGDRRLERVQQVMMRNLRLGAGGDDAKAAIARPSQTSSWKLAGEVRQQLAGSLDRKDAVDQPDRQDIHDTVVEAIREESPATAARIVAS